MFRDLTRRRRRLVFTAGLALVFVASAGTIVVVAGRPASYRPGEQVDGLTSELSRSLPQDYPRVTFTDVTRDAGITFHHFSGERTSQIPEDVGSGVAWGDYNNDGWPDLFLVNSAGPITLTPEEIKRSPARCALYRNNKDGTFTDVTEQAGLDLRIWGMGAEWGDYDNDGRLDLVVSAYGENHLYHNNGDGTFTDVSRKAGLAGRRGFWSGVAWGDYDRDGYLDLYVTGYVKYTRLQESASAERYAENPASINPNSYPPERNLLYHNDRNGTFSEVAATAGVLGDKGKSLEATWADFDGDGWPDLYVANDVTDNQLFRNLGNGKFEDISHEARVADYRSAMGLAVGDWDGDHDLDLFITHWIAQENALYTNLLHDARPHRLALRRPRPSPGGGSESRRPPLEFMDEADRYGVGQSTLDFVGWGTFFFDYDNDGRLDLFMSNGHTFQQRDAPQRMVPQTSQLFWNRGPTEGFYDVSPAGGPYFRTPYVGRGAAFADYDQDGDLDILVMNHGGPPVLLRNDGGNKNHWLNVRLEGRRSNRTADGAKLRLVADSTSWIREIGDQASYLSQNELTEHFGLGSRTGADSLIIDWPSGAHQVLTALTAGQTVTVVEGVAQSRDTSGHAATSAGGIREFWEAYRTATRHRMAGAFDAARDAYRQALEINPRHEDALYYMGGMELELGRYAEARSAWQRLVELNPGSARTHSRLGDLFACPDSGAPRNLAAAETEYRRALELNREETGPLLHLGELALIRGNLAHATSYLDTVIGSHARSIDAHFLEGYVAWKRGQPERAGALFRTTVALARAAAPAPEPPRLPGEGDTRRGSAPAIVATSRCQLFHISPERLSGVDDTKQPGQMNEMYRRLEARIARLAPKSPS